MPEPRYVVIGRRAPSERARTRAEVVERVLRQRGPHTTDPRYDFLLRFPDGWQGWFADDEVQEDISDES